jgi:hypothetical protein
MRIERSAMYCPKLHNETESHTDVVCRQGRPRSFAQLFTAISQHSTSCSRLRQMSTTDKRSIGRLHRETTRNEADCTHSHVSTRGLTLLCGISPS